jgi:ankyrin repeat protein
MLASCGHVEAVKLLLANGAEVNNQILGAPWKDYTPLHSAAFAGNAEVVRVLLEKGASVSAKAARGETPLSLAKSRGNAEVVKILLSVGAKS